ncbi:MAG: SUMF1/EgtB/PvdO family nonheme iron enzyme [Rhodothermaceae bacterium]
MKKQFFPALVILAFLTLFCTEELLMPLNNKPSVSLQLDKSVVVSNDSVTVTCSATDAEGDTLFFDWSSKFGAFTEKSKTDTLHNKINWQAKNLSDGSYYVTVTVTDKINEAVVDSVKIIVHNNSEFPIKPEMISPENGKKEVANSIELIWKGTSVEGKTLKYDLFWGKDINSMNTESDLTNTTHKINNLEYNTQYFWFVRAKYDADKFTISDTLSFTTRELLTADLDPSVEFVDVAAGSFKQGPGDTPADISYDYKIMKHEVTNKTYISFLNALFTAGKVYFNTADAEQTEVLGVYDGDAHIAADTNFVYFNLTKSEISFDGSQFSTVADSMDYPVRGVTWFGAKAFAKYYKLELPTQQEWEKAARGDTGNDYPASDTLTFAMANIMDSLDTNNDSKPDTVLNIFGGSTKVGFYNGVNTIQQGTVTIDYKSPYGAYDMAGNVLEWINDVYAGYRRTAGGSFMLRAETSKSWKYHNYAPSAAVNHIGFRCVKK